MSCPIRTRPTSTPSRKDPNVNVLEQPGLNIGYLAYNTTKKPFDDVRVRKAVNMAMNKKAIIDAVYLSTRRRRRQPTRSRRRMWSYNNAIKDDPYDPEAAKKLLAEAGYPNGFETDLWAMPVQRPYNPNAKRIAELMQADLAKVGIKAEINDLRVGRVSQARRRPASTRWRSSAGPATTAIRTTSSTSLLGCASAQRRRLRTSPSGATSRSTTWCRRPRSISDQAERTKLYEQAQVIFKDAGAVVHHRAFGSVRSRCARRWSGFKLSARSAGTLLRRSTIK